MAETQDTLLVVDDDEVVLRIFTGLSKAYGIRLELHSTGESAIASIKCRKFPYMAAVIDLFLPDMPGSAVADFLAERFPETQICICTGLDDPHNVRIARQLGWYLKKPFWSEDGMAMLNRLLART